MNLIFIIFHVVILIVILNVKLSKSQCPPIMLPPYGKFLQGQCASYTGARCYLTCELNFDMIGSCFRTCGQSGKWSGVNIICTRPSVMCPPLSMPPGVILTSGCQNMAGFSCEFGCETGAEPKGTKNIYCQVDGKWSSPVPTCPTAPPPDMSCPVVPPPAYGQFTGSGFCSNSPGSSCTVTCNPGYVPANYNTITCLANGVWSGPVTQCVLSASCPPVQIQNSVIVSGNCGQVNSVPGQTCSINCLPGFEATGPTQLLCTPNGWSPRLPACNPAQCPPLNAPANGQILGQCSPGIPTQICRFRCLPGFKISPENSGAEELICQRTGKWNKNPPSCILSGCAPLPVPQGGLWRFGDRYQPNFECPGDIGSVCELICGNGFVVQNSRLSKCIKDINGALRWDPIPTPTCVPVG